MKRAFPVAALFLALMAPSAYAIYDVTAEGAWPESWPQELEPLRAQSRTLVGPEVLFQHHAIPFADRESFEAAWPHLLAVKTPGAPIVLRRGKSFWLGEKAQAGICIHTPPEGESPVDHARDAAGERSRTIYLELVVDGQIVDLNRIALPADTPILDHRFDMPSAEK